MLIIWCREILRRTENVAKHTYTLHLALKCLHFPHALPHYKRLQLVRFLLIIPIANFLAQNFLTSWPKNIVRSQAHFLLKKNKSKIYVLYLRVQIFK